MSVRQVIHGVGLDPSTMNAGPQIFATCLSVKDL